MLFPDCIGGGLWFEPYTIIKDQKYFGPYAYFQNGKIDFTWDYTNQNYDYFKWEWYTVALPKTWDRNQSRLEKHYWSPPYLDGAGATEFMVTVDAFIKDSSGKIVGLSTVDWSFPRMFELIQKNKPTVHTHSFLIDARSGIVFLYTPDLSKKLVHYQTIKELDYLFKKHGKKTFQLNGVEYEVFLSKTHNDMIYGAMVPLNEIYGYEKKIFIFEILGLFSLTAFFYWLYLRIVDKLEQTIDSRTHALTQNKNMLLQLTQQLQTMLNATDDSIIQIDRAGIILKLNATAAKRLNGNLNELLGTLMMDHVDSGYASRQSEIIEKVFISGSPQRSEDSRNGFHFLIHYCPIFNLENEVDSIVIYAVDITERKQLEHEMEYLAFHDPLTHLGNRRLFIDRLEYTLGLMKRSPFCSAVLFMDLDNFKPLNDEYGHSAGDIVLKEVAMRIRHCLRESDIVARFGGDEFVVLINNSHGSIVETVDYIQHISEKILQSINQVFLFDITLNNEILSIEHFCQVSIGVYVFDNRTSSADFILRQADKAMYKAKDLGKNRIVFCEENVEKISSPF